MKKISVTKILQAINSNCFYGVEYHNYRNYRIHNLFNQLASQLNTIENIEDSLIKENR